MRIALLTDGIYPYVIGGMQKHSFGLARYFARAGVEVDLYHFNQSEKDIDRLELFSEEEKARIRSVIIPFPSRGSFPGHYLRESFEHSCLVYEAFLKNGRVDYVYAKGFTAWKMLDEKRKGKALPPVGVNFHGYEMFQPAPSWKSGLEQKLMRSPVLFNIRHADQVFSYGGKITPLILSLGVAEKKIIEIPTGIENGWLSREPGKGGLPRRFIFVGRYERRKGIEELNKVLKDWRGTPFEFVFAGPIPEGKQVKRAGIHYAGPVSDQEEMKLLLRNADVLVCPSHSEGMPNVILEGMASGLAVIATDVGAVSAMVDSGNGWVIKPRSEEQLAGAMEQALKTDEPALQALKRRSMEKVSSQFLWEKIIEQTLDSITEKIKAK